MSTGRITDAAEAFRYLAETGKKLMEAHLHYEEAEPYPLEKRWNPDIPQSYYVTKMRFGHNRKLLIVNESLVLAKIPQEVYEYQLGNKSALEWIVDQYQVITDERSGIVSDPNREDDLEYIVRLVCQVVTVSLETVRLTKEMATRVNLDDFKLVGADNEPRGLHNFWKR